jgi:nucleoside-diphosphate-sugar epimerase
MSGRALVTGAGGFVGAHLTARLHRDGWDVVALVRPGSDSRLAGLPVTVVPVDLTDPDATAAALAAADPDVVLHLAAARAKADAAQRRATAAVNTVSGLHVVDAVGERCRAVIRLGSSTEYAEADGPMDEATPLRPRGFFGATKAAGSLLFSAAAAERGVRSAVLRAFQVYGPHDQPGRLVPTVLRAAATGGPLDLTGPGLRRDWVHVDDVVEACVLAAARDDLAAGTVLNLGTGVQTTNEELVALAEQVTGRRIDVRMGRHPGREWDAGSWVSDPSAADRLLGWRARTGLAEGLATCWAAVAP